MSLVIKEISIFPNPESPSLDIKLFRNPRKVETEDKGLLVWI